MATSRRATFGGQRRAIVERPERTRHEIEQLGDRGEAAPLPPGHVLDATPHGTAREVGIGFQLDQEAPLRCHLTFSSQVLPCNPPSRIMRPASPPSRSPLHPPSPELTGKVSVPFR